MARVDAGAGDSAPTVAIEPLADDRLDEARGLLLDLLVSEQDHFDHPRLTRSELDQSLPLAQPTFRGENHLVVARAEGRVVGLCWCVLHDPGTGLEAEIAELYVIPERRGEGLAGRLVRAATRLFAERGVTFACVWTRPGNAAALRLYAAHGFTPTEQAVLTWFPREAGG